jgi:hypothetical protein
MHIRPLLGIAPAMHSAVLVPHTLPAALLYACCLQTHIRPLLGIAPAMHSAVLAWVHFRQYVITQAPQLLAKTRGLLYQLAAIAADAGPSGGQQEAG